MNKNNKSENTYITDSTEMQYSDKENKRNIKLSFIINTSAHLVVKYNINLPIVYYKTYK